MASALAGSLLLLLAKSGIVLGMAALVVRGRWCASAAVRHGVWTLALLSVLLLPLVGRLIPPVAVPLPDFPPIAVTHEPADHDAWAEAGAGGMPEATAAMGALPDRAASAAAEEPQASESSRAAAPIGWATLLLIVWGGGVILRLCWLLLLFARTRAITRAAPEAPVRLNGGGVRRLAAELGIRRRVRVLESPQVSMPFAWGLIKPAVIVPVGAADWPEERLRVVLLHELAHVKRWDYATSFVAELACAMYWPLPLVWHARGRLRAEQEQACDDRVLSTGTAAVAYAEHLLAVARAFYGKRWELGIVVTMAREMSLKQRVKAILDDATDRRPLRSAAGLSATIVLLGAILPIAALQGADAVGADVASVVNAIAAQPDSSSLEVTRPATERIGSGAPLAIWFEAEGGMGSGDVATGADLDASGAAYLEMDEVGRGSGATDSPPAVRYGFDLPRAGEYFLWARVQGNERQDPVSLTVTLTGSTVARWTTQFELAESWGWVRLGPAERAAPGEGVAFLAGVSYLELSRPDEDTRIDRIVVSSDSTLVPTGRGADHIVRGSYIVLEAEQGDLTGRLQVETDDDSSGDGYLIFQERRGDSNEGRAVFRFEVPESGRYLVWGRLAGPDGDSNSFHTSLDEGPEFVWDFDSRRDGRRVLWGWEPLRAREYDGRPIDPFVHELAAGEHTLRLRTRESDARLDAILITNDLERRPEGLWPANIPVTPVQIRLEPEQGLLIPPMLAAATEEQVAPAFVVTQIRERAERPGRGGSVGMRFRIEQPGLYSIWGRTIAPSGDHDSFWIRVDGGEWILWNHIPESEAWQWSVVRDDEAAGQIVQFELEPGEHTLEIAGRESEALLDSLILTNDPLFEPTPS